jgi:hypothetical protein
MTAILVDRTSLMAEVFPSQMTICGKDADVCKDPEFKVLLTHGDDEILITVFCDDLRDAERYALTHASVGGAMKRGFKFHQSWEVLGDEF